MSCPMCAQDRHYLEVERSFNDPPIPTPTVVWWAFTFDYGRKIGVIALREDRKQASSVIKVEDWNEMSEAQQASWLRGAIAWLPWKLEGL